MSSSLFSLTSFSSVFYLFTPSLSICSLSLSPQLGAPRGPHGPRLLRGPHHQDHNVATAHHGDGAQLRAVAAPAQPAAGRHAAVQPEVHIRGEAALRVAGGYKREYHGGHSFTNALCNCTFSDFSKNDCRIKSRSPPLRTKSTILWGRCRRAGVRSLSRACPTSPTAAPEVEEKTLCFKGTVEIEKPPRAGICFCLM